METSRAPGRDVITTPLFERAILVVAGLLLGGLAAWLLPRLIGWAVARDFPLLAGPLRLIDELTQFLPDVVEAPLWVLLGLLAGIVLASLATSVEVDHRQLVVHSDGKRHRYARSQVASIEFEKTRLTLHDERDVELLREQVPTPDLVRDALIRHDWPVIR